VVVPELVFLRGGKEKEKNIGLARKIRMEKEKKKRWILSELK
jgi:hypothetical protein